MLITTKTIISFHIPDECQAAERFRAQHPDWTESVTAQFVWFIRQEAYSVEMREDSE